MCFTGNSSKKTCSSSPNYSNVYFRLHLKVLES
jgi:hypothetical protein